MQTDVQKGQQVKTPDGVGSVMDVIADEVRVKLDSGEERSYSKDEIEDDADQG